eukprot:2875472-Prymnesium_polylepis.1
MGWGAPRGVAVLLCVRGVCGSVHRGDADGRCKRAGVKLGYMWSASAHARGSASAVSGLKGSGKLNPPQTKDHLAKGTPTASPPKKKA